MTIIQLLFITQLFYDYVYLGICLQIYIRLSVIRGIQYGTQYLMLSM